jgi:hypothetical protein
MVAWNERVPACRLGDGDAPHGYCLSCLACGRAVLVRHTVAIELWGAAATARDVARSLRCSRCGARRGHLQVVVDTRQPANVEANNYWNGSRLPELSPPEC